MCASYFKVLIYNYCITLHLHNIDKLQGHMHEKSYMSECTYTFEVSWLNLNSWPDLCNRTVKVIISKVSPSYSEYTNKKFEVFTEISMSNLECKCTQTCKIFHAYGPRL